MVSVKCKEWLAIKEKNEDENRRSCTCREDIVLTLDTVKIVSPPVYLHFLTIANKITEGRQI